MIVVDANVVLDAVVADAFRSLARHRPVAPPLLWSEAVAALRQAAWRGDVPAERTEEVLERLLDADIERRSPRGLYREAWTVATQLGWAKTHDAEYVALARILRTRLVTRDASLRRAAAALVTIIGPTEL